MSDKVTHDGKGDSEDKSDGSTVKGECNPNDTGDRRVSGHARGWLHVYVCTKSKCDGFIFQIQSQTSPCS